MLIYKEIFLLPVSCAPGWVIFKFDFREKGGGQGACLLEGPRITLIPKFPRSKHEERSHGFPPRGVPKKEELPPIFNLVDGGPRGRVEVHKTKPIFDQVPNANGEATMKKEVTRRLIDTPAKGTKLVIWPTPPLKTIISPHTVLND